MSPETSKAENASSNHPETTSRKFCRRWGRQGGAAALSPRHGSAAASPKEKREVLSAVLWCFFCCFFNYVHCRACLSQSPFHDAGAADTATLPLPHSLPRLRQILGCILQAGFTAPPQHASSRLIGTSCLPFLHTNHLTLAVLTPVLLG